RILRIEQDHRWHIDPAELVGAAADGDGHIGGAVTFVDGVDRYARVLEVSLLLRNEEGRVGALDDPIERDLDVLDVGMGGCEGRRDECNDCCNSADAVHRSASLCWLKVLPGAKLT